LRLALEQFICDEEKIFWTLAFFKNGHAAKWSENLFRQEVDTGIFPIQSWVDFEQQFQSQFFPVNAEVSQTSFSHISTNSSTIPTVLKPA